MRQLISAEDVKIGTRITIYEAGELVDGGIVKSIHRCQLNECPSSNYYDNCPQIYFELDPFAGRCSGPNRSIYLEIESTINKIMEVE